MIVHGVNNAGTATKATLSVAAVNALIQTAISAAGGKTVVANWAALQALRSVANGGAAASDPVDGQEFLVLDASGDPTVDTASGANYTFSVALDDFHKDSERESMDLVLSWANLTGKPSSAVADIDNAVSLRHTHSNKTELDKITEVGGRMQYDGKYLDPEWKAEAW